MNPLHYPSHGDYQSFLSYLADNDVSDEQVYIELTDLFEQDNCVFTISDMNGDLHQCKIYCEDDCGGDTTFRFWGFGADDAFEFLYTREELKQKFESVAVGAIVNVLEEAFHVIPAPKPEAEALPNTYVNPIALIVLDGLIAGVESNSSIPVTASELKALRSLLTAPRRANG